MKYKSIRGRNKKIPYSEELADQILQYVADGGTIKQMCRDYPDAMPPPSTVYGWIEPTTAGYREDFAVRYREAEIIRARIIADDVMEYSDPANIETTIDCPKKGIISTSANVNAHALAVTSRQWMLSKLDSKRYGTDVADPVELTGATAHEQVQSLIKLISGAKISVTRAQTLCTIIKSSVELDEIKMIQQQVAQLASTLGALNQTAAIEDNSINNSGDSNV